MQPLDSNAQVTFVTTATGRHLIFVPLFLWSVANSNPGCTVRIGVENPPNAWWRFGRAIDWIRDNYDVDFEFYSTNLQGVTAGAVRFIDFPKIEHGYAYFLDIDILVSLNALELHLPLLHENSLPFSNKLRSPGRLTGLHFTHSDNLWQPRYSTDSRPNRWKNLNDERLLFELVSEAIESDLNGAENYLRPMPGGHISLFSRMPFRSTAPEGVVVPGWSPTTRGSEWPSFSKSIRSDGFQALKGVLPSDSRFVALAAEVFAEAVLARDQGGLDVENVPLLVGWGHSPAQSRRAYVRQFLTKTLRR